jgi:hypothetical protein
MIFTWCVLLPLSVFLVPSGQLVAQDVLTSRANSQLINQNALENVLVDIQFLKDQFAVVGLEQFTGAFDELVMVGPFSALTLVSVVAKRI